MAQQSINPATGETLRRFDTLAPAEVMARLERAAAAFRAWKDTPFNERARLVSRAADILETAIAPTWQDIGRLGAIAVIRTFLNFFLERDLAEVLQRENENDKRSPPASSVEP